MTMTRPSLDHTYLENYNVLALVDGPLVHSVGNCEVDHLAEHHPVIHLGVHVRPVLSQLQLVRHVGIIGQRVVDPVSEGDLLLIQDCGEPSTLAMNLLVFFVEFLGRLVGMGDIVGFDFLAELQEDVEVINC